MRPYALALYNKIKFSLKRIYTSDLNAKGILLFDRNSKFRFGKNSHIDLADRIISDGRLVIIVEDNGHLRIGSRVYFNEETMISCKGNIIIGNGCQFGPNVKIFDNNHKFNSNSGVLSEHSIGKIEIGENCWIGTNVVLLKGTKIGKNSVIGAGCIIDGVIPESSIVTQDRNIKIRKMR